MRKYIIGILIGSTFVAFAQRHTVPDSETETMQINFQDVNGRINDIKVQTNEEIGSLQSEISRLESRIDSLVTNCCP